MLVLLMVGIYEVRRWDGLRWHDIPTTFLNDRSRYSSNIKVIAWTIWEDPELVRRGNYELCRRDGLRRYDIHVRFPQDWFRRSEVVKGDAHTDTHTYTRRQQGDLISLLLSFQNKKIRLKKTSMWAQESSEVKQPSRQESFRRLRRRFFCTDTPSITREKMCYPCRMYVEYQCAFFASLHYECS
jgi:hypothetical protein